MPRCWAANAYMPGGQRLRAGLDPASRDADGRPLDCQLSPRAGLVPASKDVDVGLRPDGYRGPSDPVRRH